MDEAIEPERARPPERVGRSCFECNFSYTGGIRCPKCKNPAGEPLPQGVDTRTYEEKATAALEAVVGITMDALRGDAEAPIK